MLTKTELLKNRLREEIRKLGGESLGVVEDALLEGMSLGELAFAHRLAKDRWGK